jgi:chemotaxis protein MotB
MSRQIILFTISLVAIVITMSSCASKKQLAETNLKMDALRKEQGMVEEELAETSRKYQDCEGERTQLQTELSLRKEQLADLRAQVDKLNTQLTTQMTQVGDLTVLSQSANENIKSTLEQLEDRDAYVRYLQLAKTKTDSINLALAVNLKSVLRDGIADDDVEVKVDKTVVMINLSDKMLFQSGSSVINPRADEILAKIATILKSRPGFEVMVEGYTDDVPIATDCLVDNWDLSVKRSTAVVRKLQQNHGIDPNRLIAAGRGEYNALASNNTSEGRATNRRTRIIILPKLGEFYDLLAPQGKVSK